MNLPKKWQSAKLGDVAEFVMGQAPKKVNCNHDGVGTPFVKAGEFGENRPIIREWTTTPLKESLESDVLICVVGATAGKLNLGADCAIGRSVAAVRPAKGMNQMFVYRYLQTLVQQFRKGSTGSAQGVISKAALADAPLPLCSSEHQRRIADKIDALQAKSRRAREALETAKPLLEKFRQSVLAAAFRGDLTAEWRKQNPDVEPASKLLERIRAERRARWEEAELAKMRAKGKEPKNDKWKAKYEEPESVDTSELPKLPEGWCWLGLDHCIFDGPTNGYSPKSGEDATGSISLKLSATTTGRFIGNPKTTKRLYETIANDSKYWLQNGDLLIQRANSLEYLGTAAVYDGDDNQFIYPDLMMRVRAITPELASWVRLWFNSPFGKKYIVENATGTAGNMPKINGKTVKKAVIPVPPFAELSKATTLIDALESKGLCLSEQIEGGIAQSSFLDQSILAKAFRGELVPQDPNDEPASVLLERIKADRKAAKGKKSVKSKKKQTTTV